MSYQMQSLQQISLNGTVYAVSDDLKWMFSVNQQKLTLYSLDNSFKDEYSIVSPNCLMIDGNENKIRKLSNDVIIYIRCSSASLSYVKIKYSLENRSFESEITFNKVNLSMPKFHPTEDRLIVKSDGNLYDLESQIYIQNSNLTSIIDYEIISKDNTVRYYTLHSENSGGELIRMDESLGNLLTSQSVNVTSASKSFLHCDQMKCIVASSKDSLVSIYDENLNYQTSKTISFDEVKFSETGYIIFEKDNVLKAFSSDLEREEGLITVQGLQNIDFTNVDDEEHIFLHTNDDFQIKTLPKFNSIFSKDNFQNITAIYSNSNENLLGFERIGMFMLTTLKYIREGNLNDNDDELDDGGNLGAIFAGVMTFCCICTVCCFLTKKQEYNYRSSRTAQSQNPSQSVTKISLYPNGKIDLKQLQESVCSVCLMNQCTHYLPCNHFFHLACIQSWLRRGNSCPTCRCPAKINQIRNAK